MIGLYLEGMIARGAHRTEEGKKAILKHVQRISHLSPTDLAEPAKPTESITISTATPASASLSPSQDKELWRAQLGVTVEKISPQEEDATYWLPSENQ
jgi:hypothetical protein